MKYIILIVAIAVVYVSFYLVRIFYYSYYSPLPDIQLQDTTLGTGPALKYIAAGDSTAVGEGASKVEQTYTYKIAEHFSKSNQVIYKNIGVRGARSQDIIDNQVKQIIEYQPDVITLSVGANDLTHLNGSKTVLENFKTITDSLQSQTSAQIYLTNIPNFSGAKLLPFWYVAIIEHKSKSINEQLKALANDRVHIVNIHDFGWDTFPDLSVTYAADNFHPNDTGYQNWANAFLDSITK